MHVLCKQLQCGSSTCFARERKVFASQLSAYTLAPTTCCLVWCVYVTDALLAAVAEYQAEYDASENEGELLHCCY
jgi:hypothetical protein